MAKLVFDIETTALPLEHFERRGQSRRGSQRATEDPRRQGRRDADCPSHDGAGHKGSDNRAARDQEEGPPAAAKRS